MFNSLNDFFQASNERVTQRFLFNEAGKFSASIQYLHVAVPITFTRETDLYKGHMRQLYQKTAESIYNISFDDRYYTFSSNYLVQYFI
jgi:hypothetical protein